MPISLRDVTPDDAAALARVLIGSMESFRGYVPDKCLEFPEELSIRNWQTTLNDGLNEGHFMFFALNPSGLPVGYCWGQPIDDPDYRGELKQISVLPAYQKQGIGRLMVREVARRFALHDIYSMCIHVLEVNPNRLFYERLGGQYVSQYPYDWDGFGTISHIYGWKDTRDLLPD